MLKNSKQATQIEELSMKKKISQATEVKLPNIIKDSKSLIDFFYFIRFTTRKIRISGSI